MTQKPLFRLLSGPHANFPQDFLILRHLRLLCPKQYYIKTILPRSSNFLSSLALAYVLRENICFNCSYFAPWLQIHPELGSGSSFQCYFLGRSRTGLQSRKKYGLKGNLLFSPEASRKIYSV